MVNRELAAMGVEHQDIDGNYVGKLEQGRISRPREEVRREAFRRVFQVQRDEQLGFVPYRRNAIDRPTEIRAARKEHFGESTEIANAPRLTAEEGSGGRSAVPGRGSADPMVCGTKVQGGPANDLRDETVPAGSHTSVDLIQRRKGSLGELNGMADSPVLPGTTFQDLRDWWRGWSLTQHG